MDSLGLPVRESASFTSTRWCSNGASVPAAGDTLDVSLGEIHEVLAYYNNPDVVADHRDGQQHARDELHDRVVKPSADPLTE